MDNFCVGASFLVGLILCQIPELPYSDITAFGLVGLTVYYFLYKFNGQMQELSEQNKLIMQRQEIDNNTHNQALQQIAAGFKELSAALQKKDADGKRE
ncbi:MAG: hypothetical protein IJG38_05025 [Thermoguttaceae bacterium]|nr:hypothetical protein [Thermoguttaceae bacterium]